MNTIHNPFNRNVPWVEPIGMMAFKELTKLSYKQKKIENASQILYQLIDHVFSSCTSWCSIQTNQLGWTIYYFDTDSGSYNLRRQFCKHILNSIRINAPEIVREGHVFRLSDNTKKKTFVK